jgi:hypothetical protein
MLWKNLTLRFFSLRFEIPEARRARNPKRISTIGSREHTMTIRLGIYMSADHISMDMWQTTPSNHVSKDVWEIYVTRPCQQGHTEDQVSRPRK